jgi:peptidoglycan/xylan/chitin deacetylase (PgdA/CDA1 family)
MAERNRTTRVLDAVLTSLAWASERHADRRPAVAIVTYHRVAPEGDRPDLVPGLAVTPEAFAEQVAMLATHADPVSMDDLVDAADGAPLPPRAVHVTFDDAYACIAEHAWPVLRERGVPATMFVPTRHPDQGRTFWWDRLHQAIWTHPDGWLVAAGRSWPLTTSTERERARADLRRLVASRPHCEAMAIVDEVWAAAGCTEAVPATASWASLRAMAAQGLAMASHTRLHPFLDQISPERLDREIGGSFDDLRQQLGSVVRPAIAYPGGHLDDLAAAATRRAEIRIGLTTERGVTRVRPDTDWLRLPRVNVGRRTSVPLVRAQLRPEPHRARHLVRTAISPRHRPGEDHRPLPWRALWN